MAAATQMVVDCILEVQTQAEKLVLIVGQPGSGKSKVLRELAEMRGWKYVHCKTLITEELLELVPRVRSQEAPRIMDKILGGYAADVCLIDGIELLFTPLLKLEPLLLLRQLSRKHTLVVAWPGRYEGEKLIFEYNHGLVSGYREYLVQDLPVIWL
ncbi:MAG: BREX-3 system P-loop-containing protein BrxF [Negativicutes bacterium]|nr:BREX-3 system P-loop-containing protein BrxF [Negativicutes bacterium]